MISPYPNPPEEDSGLRAAFARQRAGDHANAPAWRDADVMAPAAREDGQRRWWVRPAWALPAAVVLVLVFQVSRTAVSEPRLSDVLPPLLEPGPAKQDGELFASLSASTVTLFSSPLMPSDVFLPPDSAPPPAIHLKLF